MLQREKFVICTQNDFFSSNSSIIFTKTLRVFSVFNILSTLDPKNIISPNFVFFFCRSEVNSRECRMNDYILLKFAILTHFQ